MATMTSLPPVGIPFDDLRDRMAAFTLKFDTFIEKSRKQVLEERNEHKARMSELNGTYACVPGVRQNANGACRGA